MCSGSEHTVGTQRSLILLFTNFETLDAVNRQMKYLRGIAKNHLLVIIFFKNAELQSLINTKIATPLKALLYGGAIREFLNVFSIGRLGY